MTDEEITCGICRDSASDGSHTLLCDTCKHTFHVTCLIPHAANLSMNNGWTTLFASTIYNVDRLPCGVPGHSIRENIALTFHVVKQTDPWRGWKQRSSVFTLAVIAFAFSLLANLFEPWLLSDAIFTIPTLLGLILLWLRYDRQQSYEIQQESFWFIFFTLITENLALAIMKLDHWSIINRYGCWGFSCSTLVGWAVWFIYAHIVIAIFTCLLVCLWLLKGSPPPNQGDRIQILRFFLIVLSVLLAEDFHIRLVYYWTLLANAIVVVVLVAIAFFLVVAQFNNVNKVFHVHYNDPNARPAPLSYDMDICLNLHNGKVIL